MDMTGEYRIPAPRQKVWEALNDPDILKQAIPGCDEIEKESDTAFNAKVTTKLGPVKAKFAGAVTLSDLNPPESYTISGEGKGGAAGFAKGGAKVHLAEDGGETVLTYEVNASVGGKIAQLGGRLIDSTARKLADQFFSKFAEIVSSGAAPAAAAPTEPETPAEPKTTAEPEAPAEPEATAEPAEPAPPAGPAVPPLAEDQPLQPQPVPEKPAAEAAIAAGGAAAPIAATAAAKAVPAEEEDSPSTKLHTKMEEARTEESVSMTNPYLWVGAVIGLVIVLLLLWAFGAF